MGSFAHAPKSGDKFIWVRFGALGDVLQALSSAFVVKQRFPDISMSFLTTPPFVDIVKSQPYIDEVICGEKKPLSILIETSRRLRNENFTWIASTFKGSKMSWLAYLSGIKNRLGSSKYFPFLETANVYEWAKGNFIDIQDRSNPSIFATDSYVLEAKELLASLEGRKKFFAVIGASSESKMWPLEHWVALVRNLVDDGWGIVINGYGDRELAFANSIKAEIVSPNVLNLVGHLNYLKMSAVVRQCDVSVGNDTGPLHLAALSGVTTIGLFDYIPPVEVGYSMPWFYPIVSREQPLQTFYAKRRSNSLLAEITPDIVLRKIYNTLKDKAL